MRRCISILAVILGIATGTMMADPPPRPGDRDDTTIRPELVIDPSDGVLRIHGVVRVVNPDAPFDHAVVVRLSVFDPASGDELHSEDLSSFAYPRDHPGNVAYPVHGQWAMDVRGLAVKVSVSDVDTGHEFCSVVAR